MKIAVIGHGNVGAALARAWSRAGHEVSIGARDTVKAQAAFADMQAIAVTSVNDAVKAAEVILVAVPAHVSAEIGKQLGSLKGKVIIDATNAVRQKPEPWNTAFDALKELTGAELVKCFNSTGFENMKNPDYNGQKLDMFMAGSSTTAKEAARRLALDAGFGSCIDFGGDDKAALLEQFALSWINLAIFQGMGRDIAFKLIHRQKA